MARRQIDVFNGALTGWQDVGKPMMRHWFTGLAKVFRLPWVAWAGLYLLVHVKRQPEN